MGEVGTVLAAISGLLALLNIVVSYFVKRLLKDVDSSKDRIAELEKWKAAEEAVQCEREKRHAESANKVLRDVNESLKTLGIKLGE